MGGYSRTASSTSGTRSPSTLARNASHARASGSGRTSRRRRGPAWCSRPRRSTSRSGTRAFDLPPPFGSLETVVTARLYDYGAVSLRFDIPITPATDLESLIPLCDHLYDAPELDACGRTLLASFLPEIVPAIEGAHSWQGMETYTVVFVRQLRGDPTPKEVLASPILLRLLLGERSPTPPLSELERTDVLQHAQSYYADDLVVVDWNSAFVLEPSGSRVIPDILEFANSQLLELRYYDDTLDAELARIYDDFAEARRNPLGLLWSPYSKLARNVLRRIIEVTEFTERVDNALKVVGDFYVARITKGRCGASDRSLAAERRRERSDSSRRPMTSRRGRLRYGGPPCSR